jgi:hypothetical protein
VELIATGWRKNRPDAPTLFEWEHGAAGWTEIGRWSLPRQLWADSKEEGELADVNADGLLDFVHDGNASQHRATWLNTGKDFALDDDWRTPDDLYSLNAGMPTRCSPT